MIKASATNERVTAFLDEISEFKRISATSTVSSLINKILVKTGYENTVYLYNNGGNCYNNLLLFKVAASDYEENVQRGLSAFVAYVKRQIANKDFMKKVLIFIHCF